MNKETKILIVLVAADNCCRKILFHNLIPAGQDLVREVRADITTAQARIFSGMSDMKVMRCARKGDLFLDNVRQNEAMSVNDTNEKDAELFYSFSLILLLEDLIEISKARAVTASILIKAHKLNTLCRKKNYYLKMLEAADSGVKEIYQAIDDFKEEDLETTIEITAKKEPLSMGKKLALGYKAVTSFRPSCPPLPAHNFLNSLGI